MKEMLFIALILNGIGSLGLLFMLMDEMYEKGVSIFIFISLAFSMICFLDILLFFIGPYACQFMK